MFYDVKFFQRKGENINGHSATDEVILSLASGKKKLNMLCDERWVLKPITIHFVYFCVDWTIFFCLCKEAIAFHFLFNFLRLLLKLFSMLVLIVKHTWLPYCELRLNYWSKTICKITFSDFIVSCLSYQCVTCLSYQFLNSLLVWTVKELY